ncbi:MAG: hypothetical protein P1T08_08235 [Acidimicrobiia bacterium]|nr:hypothetical protein [Acidimicrobiia bacterium]
MRIRFLIPFLIAVLAGAACSGDDESTTTLADEASATTTSVLSGDTSGDSGGVDTPGSNDGSTTTTSEVAALPTYEVVHRSPGDNGDLLVIVLDDDGSGVTDHELEQVILDVVDTFGPVAEAHVIDDPSVLELVLADPADLTDDQKADLDAHYLLKLVDGTSVSFEGPFQDVPGYEIGS